MFLCDGNAYALTKELILVVGNFSPRETECKTILNLLSAQSLISRLEFMAAVEPMRVFMLMDSVFILMAIGHTLRTN